MLKAKVEMQMAKVETQPDELGHWGTYGGGYVPETLMAPLEELAAAYLSTRTDPAFGCEFNDLAEELRRQTHAAMGRGTRIVLVLHTPREKC